MGSSMLAATLEVLRFLPHRIKTARAASEATPKATPIPIPAFADVGNGADSCEAELDALLPVDEGPFGFTDVLDSSVDCKDVEAVCSDEMLDIVVVNEESEIIAVANI